jgi:NAD(P)-dependent dehydrogenase (short-subunit alcohol dehydrogenase family)
LSIRAWLECRMGLRMAVVVGAAGGFLIAVALRVAEPGAMVVATGGVLGLVSVHARADTRPVDLLIVRVMSASAVALFVAEQRRTTTREWLVFGVPAVAYAVWAFWMFRSSHRRKSR